MKETLAQFAARIGVVLHPRHGDTLAILPMPDKHRPDAYHLADYYVSASVSGPCLEFRPRDKPEPTADYGSDPLGGGQFRMVPSGDVVDRAERDRRLAARNRPDVRNEILGRTWAELERLQKSPIRGH